MNIAFFGDSFSDRYDGYPRILCQHYNAQYTNFSFAASSFEYCFNNLINFFEHDREPEVAIITITSSDRIYHPDYRIMPSMTLGLDIVPEYFLSSINNYYKNIHTDQLSYIRFRIFCSSLVGFTIKYPKTKFIFLPCFDEWIEGITAGNFVVTKNTLLNFAMLDKIAMDNEVKGIGTERNNHLSEKQNECLAKDIIKIIDNYVYNKPSFYELNLTEL